MKRKSDQEPQRKKEVLSNNILSEYKKALQELGKEIKDLPISLKASFLLTGISIILVELSKLYFTGNILENTIKVDHLWSTLISSSATVANLSLFLRVHLRNSLGRDLSFGESQEGMFLDFATLFSTDLLPI